MKILATFLALIISTSSFATSLTMKEGVVDLTFKNNLKGSKVSINSVTIISECKTNFRGFDTIDGIHFRIKSKIDSRVTKPHGTTSVEILSNDQKVIALSVDEVFTLTSPEKKLFKDKSCTLVISGNVDVINTESNKNVSQTSFNLVYIDTKENVTDALAMVNAKSKDLTISARVDGSRAGTGAQICTVTLQTNAGKTLKLGGGSEEVCAMM